MVILHYIYNSKIKILATLNGSKLEVFSDSTFQVTAWPSFGNLFGVSFKTAHNSGFRIR